MQKDISGTIAKAGPIQESRTADAPDNSALNADRRRFWIRILATGFSTLILFLSAIIVTRILLTTDYHAMRLAVQAMRMEQFAAAFLFTAISYLALTGYDAVAIRQLQLKVHFATTALASFTSYAISFTLGFPLVTAGTVRYWIYSRAGVSAANVASLTLISGITFWLGMVLMIGIAFMLRPGHIAQLNQLTASLNFALGCAAVASILLYIIWVSRHRRRLSVKGIVLELPGFKLTVGQLMLGTIDLLCASAALYILLPEGHGLGFMTFVAIYVLGCLLGIASHAPGGIGAFEVTIINMVPSTSVEALLAALLLFRLIYYVVPFVFAFALLGANEIWRRWRGLRAEMSHQDVPK